MSGLSAQTGVKLIPDKKWSSSRSKKELHYNKDDLINLPFDVVRGLMLHEMGHLLFSTGFTESDTVKKYGAELMSTIYNTFEDMRIEKKLDERFGNYSRYGLDSVDAWGVEQHLFNSGGNYDKLPKVEQFLILSLFRFYSNHVTDSSVANYLGFEAEYLWSPNQWNYPIATFDKKVKMRHKAKRIKIRSIIEDCYDADNAVELQSIVDNELVPIIKDFIEDKEDKKKREEDKKKQQQGQGQGQGKGQSQPQQGQGKGQGKDGANGSGDNDKGNQDVGMVKGGGRGFSTQSPANNIKRTNVAKPTEAEAKTLLNSLSFVFSQKLKDVLKEQKAIRFTGNHKSGKLLNKNAYKVAIGGETRIFSKRNNPDTPNYAVYLGLDSSGSMEGERQTFAFLGAVLLKDVCKRLGFPIRIFSYDTRVTELKKLDEYDATGGGTDDSSVFRAINKVIDGTQDNLVFIVTDGETYRDGDFDALKKGLKKKNAITFGVGIGEMSMERSLKKNYDNAVCVEKVEKLPSTLLTLIKSIIHR